MFDSFFVFSGEGRHWRGLYFSSIIIVTECRPMVSKPTGKCVKVKFTIVPTLGGRFNHPLRCLRIFLSSVWKEDTGVGLTLIRKSILQNAALWGRTTRELCES